MRILILGATSAIAHAAARRFARDGARLVLAARDAERLAANAADLRARGATSVETVPFDALAFGRHAEVVDAAWRVFDGLDGALLAWGTLPDPAAVNVNADDAVEAFEANATSVISVLTHLAGRFEAQRSGVIAVIGSVAGDRGRASNYVYGAAKGAVALFAGGLRGRLAPADVPKNPLFADAAAVGARIHAAMLGGGEVVYAPGFWRPVMAGIRAVPERLFKRLPL